MLISLNWLADYVQIQAPPGALVEKLLMAGLNHESTTTVGADTAVEIEVTSNRPDCLGHIGVAREAALLFGRPLHLPDPWPLETAGETAASVTVEILSPEMCPFYSARVIRGVHVGPSPKWLVDRLATAGVESVNNVVDVTNFVMLECGQPLHAFDLAKLKGGRIVVRRATDGEQFTAINHKTYTLAPQMCVIADAERPVALAGVMGGADTEISAATTDVLIESAQFAPLAVRAAARGLVLASASSYRFERMPDPAAVDWAGRRAAGLILDVAGGMLERGAVTTGSLAGTVAEIPLRPDRVAQVLGIDVPPVRQHAILTGLGFVDMSGGAVAGEPARWRAPSWRRDVWREIDLVEEIGRIEGYGRVPEDRPISARPVELSARETTIRTASGALEAAGLCEAMTRSVVSAKLETWPGPWGGATPLVVQPALVRGADRLRRTLLPSLLEARAGNVSSGAPHGDLFEVARAYAARNAGGDRESPVEEPLLMALVTGGGFFAAKGLVEAVLDRLGVARAGGVVTCRPTDLDLFIRGRAAELTLSRGSEPAARIAVIGEFAAAVLDAVGLSGTVAGAEVRLDHLEFAASGERRLRRPSDYPAVERDVNLVVADAVPWADIETAIRGALGPLLEQCRIAQIWRDAERLGAGVKSVVVTLRLRSDSGTLSGDDANRVVQAAIDACRQAVGAELRA
jgi:phenylalanyl-tRNA synthetase beta chain